jgi:hypothetical protein
MSLPWVPSVARLTLTVCGPVVDAAAVASGIAVNSRAAVATVPAVPGDAIEIPLTT